MQPEIIQIDENTRQRLINGEYKLEKKDSIHGVWVIHPVQFYKDNQETINNMFEEMKQDDRREEENLKNNPEKIKEFVLEKCCYDDEERVDLERMRIIKAVDVKINTAMSGYSIMVIFDGKTGDKTTRYYATYSYHSGSFYEPPDGDGEITTLKSYLDYKEEYINSFIDVKIGKTLGNNEVIDTEEKRVKEIERCKRIIWRDIEKRDYLKKFLN